MSEGGREGAACCVHVMHVSLKDLMRARIVLSLQYKPVSMYTLYSVMLL